LVAGHRATDALGFTARPDPWIELANHQQRRVTAEDLAQWDREAPRETGNCSTRGEQGAAV
jgi:hypothetical protein